jgi:hypothetical protein
MQETTMSILEETFAALAAQKRRGIAEQINIALRDAAGPEEHQAIAELVLAMAVARVVARDVVDAETAAAPRPLS